jgi:hypothetical protein
MIETADLSLACTHAAADIGTLFVDDDSIALSLQFPCTGQAGNAGADDGDMHELIPIVRIE